MARFSLAFDTPMVITMRPSNIQNIISQSTASLDQYWENIEIMYPFVCELSHEIPQHLDEGYREVARLCCQLVGWELALRSLKKNRTCKCTIKYQEGGTSIVEILTSEGFVTFIVPDSSLIIDEYGVRTRITSYRVPDGYHKVFLPIFGEDNLKDILIPETEIEQEYPDDI